MDLIRKHFFSAVLLAFCAAVFVISLRVTLFRYNNYEYGKFDLGNMSQMVYNTLHGNFMEVTDYFGANMPRWGMSHVDPFLVVFVPFYAIWPDARVLIIGQLFLLISSAIPLYLISLRVLKSAMASLFVAMAFLFYPAVGYLLAWTGFHGVTAVVPLFLWAFYVFEEMAHRNKFSKKAIILFFILCILTMTGKEEISLIFVMYGLFIVFFRHQKKLGLALSALSLVWFCISFFVLIPSAAHYRIEGYKTFAKSVELDAQPSRDVLNSNYFLSRYGEFGDSYAEVAVNIVLNPLKVGDVFFSGDRKENFMMTFLPVLFLPFLSVPLLLIASPEFAINYLTTQSGIGTSEIYNHRISMILPPLFISALFSIHFIDKAVRVLFKRKINYLKQGLALILLLSNVYFSNKYQNPVMFWFTQSVGKRLSSLPVVYAASGSSQGQKTNYVPGDKAKVNKLETKDRTCFNDAVALIPANASVTSPDYLGDHLSARRYNALFPANFDTADYVIVDIFSRKVLTILGVDLSLLNNVVGKTAKNPNYRLIYSCSNIFVFEKGPNPLAKEALPLQEEFDYIEKVDFKLGDNLKIVDYKIDPEVERAKAFPLMLAYKKIGNGSLNSFILFTSFMNSETGKLYQVANLPSFGIIPISNWSEGNYYVEENLVVLPKSIPAGNYKVFIGITNNLKTYNIFISDLKVK